MSVRIRGQEITVKFIVDGSPQDGSFAKVTEFSTSMRSDLPEESFLGELTDDVDFQHHGFDFSFSVHNNDEEVLTFLSTIINNEELAVRHPDITMVVIYNFRDPAVTNRVEVFHDVYLRVAEQSFGGRKEYVSSSFEGKAKRRSLLTA